MCVHLTPGASLAVITSLEEILCTVARAGAVESSLVKALWELVGIPLVTPRTKDSGLHSKQLGISRGAMCVLAMIAKASPEVISTPTGLARIREVSACAYARPVYGGTLAVCTSRIISYSFVCVVMFRLESL